jgi:carbon storage regulator
LKENFSEIGENSNFCEKFANVWNAVSSKGYPQWMNVKSNKKCYQSQGGLKMLVLSRKEGERIVIGDNITLIVSKVSGNRVTIGIEAPKDVKVVRGELNSALNTIVPDKVESKPVSLREFAASILPLQRQVG